MDTRFTSQVYEQLQADHQNLATLEARVAALESAKPVEPVDEKTDEPTATE